MKENKNKNYNNKYWMELNPQYLTFKLLEIGHTAHHRM